MLTLPLSFFHGRENDPVESVGTWWPFLLSAESLYLDHPQAVPVAPWHVDLTSLMWKMTLLRKPELLPKQRRWCELSVAEGEELPRIFWWLTVGRTCPGRANFTWPAACYVSPSVLIREETELQAHIFQDHDYSTKGRRDTNFLIPPPFLTHPTKRGNIRLYCGWELVLFFSSEMPHCWHTREALIAPQRRPASLTGPDPAFTLPGGRWPVHKLDKRGSHEPTLLLSNF